LKKYKLCLVSNSRIENVNLILEQLKIKSYFDLIVTPVKNLNPKPSPDMYDYVVNIVGVEPIDSIIFEDSPAGIEAAVNAKCNVVEIGSIDSVTLENIEYVIEKITNDLNSYGGKREKVCRCRL